VKFHRKRDSSSEFVNTECPLSSGSVTHRFTLSRPFLCWKPSMRFHFSPIRRQNFATRLAVCRCHLKCQGSWREVGQSAWTAR
jgi:hypothetical protein